ncbi:MAG: helix-turn-helix domain-containing protein [Pseudomonadota bacterium]
MDAIFKALNDPARRRLLDALRDKDGQTLTDLQAQFDTMTRFGVMKHLKVLEEAHLIVTRRKGRFKHHYLNALPLQEVIDRWIEPLLAKPAARGVLDLKTQLERKDRMTDKPEFVMQTYIRCSQDALWDALRDPASVQHYHFVASHAERRGDDLIYFWKDGNEMLVCREVEQEPKTRLVTTFEPKWDPDVKPSRVVYLIAVEGEHCRLTVEHYNLTYGPDGVGDGWARTMAGLKSWLETGADVHFTSPEMADA